MSATISTLARGVPSPAAVAAAVARRVETAVTQASSSLRPAVVSQAEPLAQAKRAVRLVNTAAMREFNVRFAAQKLTKLTDAERAQAIARLDLEHIFEGSRGGGMHWATTPSPTVRGFTMSPSVQPSPGMTWAGSWVGRRGGTELRKFSTMFPTDMPRVEVVRAALAAASGRVVGVEQGSTVREATYRGILVRAHVDATNAILTAYPTRSGMRLT